MPTDNGYLALHVPELSPSTLSVRIKTECVNISFKQLFPFDLLDKLRAENSNWRFFFNNDCYQNHSQQHKNNKVRNPGPCYLMASTTSTLSQGPYA